MRNANVILLTLIICLLAACTPLNEAEWSKKTSEFSELPSSIGDNTPHEPPFELPVNFNDGLAQKTEYQEPTNKVFNTGISISAGKHLPGDEVLIRIERGDGLTYRYRLTERNASLEVISVLKEEVTSDQTFRFKLPEKEGVLYLLSAELLNQENAVEDTLLSLIEVPKQSINARLFTDKENYHGEEKVTLNLENFGPTDFTFGVDYRIEQLNNDKWHTLEFENLAFDTVGIILKPGETYKQTIQLPGLPAATYRLVKTFRGEGTKLEATLAANFNVID